MSTKSNEIMKDPSEKEIKFILDLINSNKTLEAEKDLNNKMLK